jgi:hypothetical protein
MCDKLVFDLAQEVEGSPSVFIRKDWINILDNQTSNYTSNQSVLDTSQLSNSSKWMSYRESFFIIPMTMTLATTGKGFIDATVNGSATADQLVQTAYTTVMQPSAVVGTNSIDLSRTLNIDKSLGLKNWFGNIIHSFTLDYNGSTIIQQTPFVNMWNSFKLMTSLSYNDVITQGCTIGFYPDDAKAFTANFYNNVPTLFNGGSMVGVIPLETGFVLPHVIAADQSSEFLFPSSGELKYANVLSGNGVVNNSTVRHRDIASNFNWSSYNNGLQNEGLYNRAKWINYDDLTFTNSNTTHSSGSQLKTLLNQASCSDLWKSYISSKTNQDIAAVPAGSTTFSQTTPGYLEYSIIATVYLKHIHSFFNMVPLLKGVFMKMTMNLNNSASTVVCGSSTVVPQDLVQNDVVFMSQAYQVCTNSSSALGGVNPIHMSSVDYGSGSQNLVPTSILCPSNGFLDANDEFILSQEYRLSLSVGGTVLDQVTRSIPGIIIGNNNPCKSIYLYIPAYTFNPTFEQAYISSPVKSIQYSDIYQYQVLNIGSSGQFNNLLTNGIANVKSVLLLPFFSTQNDTAQGVVTPNLVPTTLANSIANNTGYIPGNYVWQSPFDPAGCGPTSPLCHFTNFNVQVSGQNAIYNLQLRAFEQFNNQLYGQNAVNGGLTDGITSSLVDRQQFDLEYCYYYVNVERMLPVEKSVPKSIQILGTNKSSRAIDLMCFIEYGTEVQIDVLTGARV